MGKFSGKSVDPPVLFYENTDWGESAGEAWKKCVEKYDFEVVLDEKYPANFTTFRPVVSKIKSAKPDALLLTKCIAEQQIDIKAYVTIAGKHADPVFLENVGAAGNYYFDLTENSPYIGLAIARETNEKYKEIPCNSHE